MRPLSRSTTTIVAGVILILLGYLFNARPAISHYPNRAAVVAAGLARAEPLPRTLTTAASHIELETWKPGRYKYVRRYWSFQVPFAFGDSVRQAGEPLNLAAAVRTFDRPLMLPDWPAALLHSSDDRTGYSGVYNPNEQACVVVSPSRTWVYVWPCRVRPG